MQCEQTQKCSKHYQTLPVRWFILLQIDATDFTANKVGTCLLPPAWGMTTNGDRSAEEHVHVNYSLSPRYCHVETVPYKG